MFVCIIDLVYRQIRNLHNKSLITHHSVSSYYGSILRYKCWHTFSVYDESSCINKKFNHWIKDLNTDIKDLSGREWVYWFLYHRNHCFTCDTWTSNTFFSITQNESDSPDISHHLHLDWCKTRFSDFWGPRHIFFLIKNISVTVTFFLNEWKFFVHQILLWTVEFGLMFM